MAAISDGASSISVTVRVRPFTIREAAQLTKCDDGPLFLGDGSLAAIPTPKLAQKGIRPVIKVVDDKCLIFDPPEDNPIRRFSKSVVPNSGKRVKDQTFGFDRVFDENTTQADVYEATTRGLLDSVLDGYNATVFAYGATGCGKTHTITGTTAHPGIIFLTMQELFERINERSEDKHTEVCLSYLEIYNETIRDLLAPPGSKGGLMLREDANQAVSVAGLSSHNPQNVREVMEMIMIGNELRTVNPTEANATSSRSHAVLQINVSQKDRNADVNEPHTMATLSIIDLAGSERASATKNRGDRLLEGANINKSLLALGSCINALCDPRKKNHVPYRNSKLTRLLKFSLGGNCKTVMIVCVSPSSQHFDETQNTLRYANRAKNIQTKVTRNVYNVNRHVKDFLKKIDEQMALINELKAQNKDHEGMAMMKFKKRSEKKMAIANEGIARLRAAYEHSGQERQERTNNMRRLRQVERRISILSSWVASFDHLCDGLDNGEDDLPTNLNAMRRTAQGVLAELEGSRQHFHQRLAKGNWVRAIDSALQTGIRQLTDVDGCTDGTEIATLTREAELLKSNAEREAHTSVIEEEKGVEASIVQGLLSTHFETISSLHRILSMDEAGAIQAARQILMKVLSSCSNATSQLVKPDVNATPCIPCEAYPPNRHGTPKRKKQASYFVEPSPLRGMISAPSLHPRLAPSAMGSLIPSSPLKSSPRRHHRRPPILSHKKGITFPPTPTRSRATKAGGLLPGGKRAVRWRDDTENGTLAEFQVTPPPPISDPSMDESPSEREELPMVPEHAYLKLVGHLPPPSSTQPIDRSALSSAADIGSSPIPIAPETTVVGEWNPALTVPTQPQPQLQQDGSREGRAVRGSRFRTGFLSKKSDGSPAPPAPPRRTNLNSDSETSPSALRELEPSRAGNRGLRMSQLSKDAMSSSSSPEMMAGDDIARVRKAMRRMSSVGGGRERSSLVHRRRSPTASSSISAQIGRARSNSPTEESTNETESREGGELFGCQGKMFGSGHARRMVRSEKENYFGGGALTPRGTGAVVKSGGNRRMTVGEAGAKVGGMMGGLRVDSGRMSAIVGSGGGTRNSGSGKGAWR